MPWRQYVLNTRRFQGLPLVQLGNLQQISPTQLWVLLCLQEQAQLLAAGYGEEFTTQASNAALFHMRSMLMRLPPPHWVQQQVSISDV